MQRAAVLIGVGKTGKLPPLPGTTDAVRRMADWLRSQQVPDDRISQITDDTGPVDIRMIKKAVAAQIKRDDVEQLIVYFSGHGINLRYSEYWLLSDAPEDTGAAVNLDGSVVLARQCGVPHVVFVSDACRTAPEGLQFQYITGGEIFPNELDNEATEAPVDIFFACALGKPALEIRDPEESARAYSSAFTKALLAALNGEKPTVLEQVMENGQRVGVVRPRPLGSYLRDELPRLLQAALGAKYTQLPYARITSYYDAWLSKIPLPDVGTRRERTTRNANRPAPPASSSNLDSTVQKLLNETLQPKDIPAADKAFPGAELLRQSASLNLESFGPGRFETECGFKVRGATIRDAVSETMDVMVVDQERTILRANPHNNRAGQVMIELQDGSSVLLPAIPQFVCALTFEEDELADVTYEPSEGSQQWADYQANMERWRALRAIIASSAQLGVFRLEEANAAKIATRIRYQKGYDPTMAIFAAYAFNDLRMHDALRSMYDAMLIEMGVRLFDVAMLARQLDDDRTGPYGEPVPVGPFPLLSQGWALLRVYGVEMSDLLLGLQRRLKPSLWTYFDEQGSQSLKKALSQGELR
jgi:hypothetical protein